MQAPLRPHPYPFTHTTPLHATTLHHTPTPSARHVSELCKIVFPKYSSQSHQQGSRIVGVPSVNPQPGCFTNNSLGLPHAHSLSVCLFLWVCVVCVCFLLYLSFCLCCQRCVVCVQFCIHNHLFVFCLLFQWIQRYLCHGALDVRITLLLHLSPLSICIFINLIPAYVYLNMHTHFPPVHIRTHLKPYSYVFLVFYFYIYTHLFVFFHLFPKHHRHLCYGVYWCHHTPPHILILWFLQSK